MSQANPPDPSQYTMAVQTPAVAFADARLLKARPAIDKWGIPLVASGGFAVAFRLETAHGAWAVRCFSHRSDHLAERYAHISKFIHQLSAPFLLETEFLPRGMRVDGAWWPITLMPWVDGAPLNDWTQAHLSQPAGLAAMRQSLMDVVHHLEMSGAAHGDLQHGNVLVAAGDRPILIDYDGMYVPGLSGMVMPEAGHTNYQHPDRGQLAFGPGLDRYAAISIWSALLALEARPDLWSEFDTGENMLFTGKDYADPARSALLAALRSDERTRAIAIGIERVASVRAEHVPTLSEFAKGKLPALEERPRLSHGSIAPYPVIDLRRPEVLGNFQGRVIAVGEVRAETAGTTSAGDPYLFVDLGSRHERRLKIVIWSETLHQLTSTQRQGLRKGRVVAVTGVLSEWAGRMQIVLERAALLELPTAARVKELVGTAWHEPPPTSSTVDVFVGDVVEHHRFGQGVVQRVDGNVAEIRFSVEIKRIAFKVYALRIIQRASKSSPGQPTPTAKPPATRKRPASAYDEVMNDWMDLVHSNAPASHQPPQPRAKRSATTGQRSTVGPSRSPSATHAKPKPAPTIPRTAAPVAPSAPKASLTTRDAIWIAAGLVVLAVVLAFLVSLN
jgi:hypothetical protein